MKMEPIVSSETSAIRTQTPGNYPKRNKLHLEHGESLKTKHIFYIPVTQSVSIWDATMHFNMDSSWIFFLRRPEDDLIKVETCHLGDILFLLCIK